MDAVDVWFRVRDNFLTITAPNPHQGSEEWYESCVEHVQYDERDSHKCMWFNAEMYPIMLRGIILPGLLPDSFLRSDLVSKETMSNINLTWVPLGFSSIIVRDCDLTSSHAQEVIGEFDMVIVNYNGDHFVTWLRYYPIYELRAISSTRISEVQWHTALSKTRMVRRIQSKLPTNPFGSENQLVDSPRQTTDVERDYTSAEITVANVSLADALQRYDPTHIDPEDSPDTTSLTHNRAIEIPESLSITREDVFQQCTGPCNIGSKQQTSLPRRQEQLTNSEYPAPLEPSVTLLPRILPAKITATRPRAHGLT